MLVSSIVFGVFLEIENVDILVAEGQMGFKNRKKSKSFVVSCKAYSGRQLFKGGGGE